ncbi:MULTISPECIES: hypothetical protein [Legionella]|uniref:hypothetical protein n=1 Tax=Legionella TaxID=445 RepID=UPI000963A1B2|nr:MULTISPECIES: hypothetical protein [Legionella]MBN9227825.1 hypothetical protein [Legionella steelei]OJW08760.1 MAG: hypothetical protein BGO44_02070 [Legionella sp. 39-23]
MTKKSKIERLNILCDKYKRHLEEALISYVKDMPKDVINYYTNKEGNIDINKIIEQANTGRSLYWPANVQKYQWTTPSWQLHPELYLVLNKYKIVNQMKDALNNPSVPDEDLRIKACTNVLTEKNKDTLRERRDSNKGVQFLENVLHVLSLGIYSKVTKGTFKFWQSHGEALSENIEEVSKEESNLKIK